MTKENGVLARAHVAPCGPTSVGSIVKDLLDMPHVRMAMVDLQRTEINIWIGKPVDGGEGEVMFLIMEKQKLEAPS